MKNGIIVYYEYQEHFSLLSDSELGQLTRALIEYDKTGVVPEFEGMLKMAYSFIKADLDINKAKYIQRCEKNRENINKRWSNDNTNEYDCIGTNTKHTDRDNDRDNENDIGNKDLNAFFESLWKLYPRKEGKGAISKIQKKKLHDIGYDEMTRAIDRYKKDKQGIEPQYIKTGSTFFNSGYIDYLDANYNPPQGQAAEGKWKELD